jgi:hypothetical protein
VTVHNGRSVDTIEGVVEQTNSTGLRLNGTWFSVSKFAPVDLPAAGTRVRVQADERSFIKSLEVVTSENFQLQEITKPPSTPAVEFAKSRQMSELCEPTTDYLAQIRDLLRAQISTLSSVQLERTSRGVNVSVKCYATDLAEAARLAEAEYDRLAAKYDAG